MERTMKIKGSNGPDKLAGSPKADVLLGRRGDDYLDGMDGADILKGGRGNDWLVGGDGIDAMVGGKGRDVFVLRSFDEVDAILDFRPGQDRILIDDPAIDFMGEYTILPQHWFGIEVAHSGSLVTFKGAPIASIASGLDMSVTDFLLA